jgi:hypothetical protein
MQVWWNNNVTAAARWRPRNSLDVRWSLTSERWQTRSRGPVSEWECCNTRSSPKSKIRATAALHPIVVINAPSSGRTISRFWPVKGGLYCTRYGVRLDCVNRLMSSLSTARGTGCKRVGVLCNVIVRVCCRSRIARKRLFALILPHTHRQPTWAGPCFSMFGRAGPAFRHNQNLYAAVKYHNVELQARRK